MNVEVAQVIRKTPVLRSDPRRLGGSHGSDGVGWSCFEGTSWNLVLATDIIPSFVGAEIAVGAVFIS
jgi:hypothetical protein